MTTNYRKQIKQAEALSPSDLQRHAMVGRVCHCNDCFCCAADHVRYVREKRDANLNRLKKSGRKNPRTLERAA